MKRLLAKLTVLTITLTILFKIDENYYSLKQVNQYDKDKINDVIEALNKIENEEVELSSRFSGEFPIDLRSIDVAQVVKTLTKYKNAINGVALKEELILEDSNGDILKPYAFATIGFGDVITVKGKVKSGIEEKDFKFTVKVKEKLTDWQKLSNAVLKIESIRRFDIKIPWNGINVKRFENLIKNFSEFTDVVSKDKIILKKDLTLKNTGIILEPDDVIYHNSWITVEGTVQTGTKEKNFKFIVLVLYED